MFPIAIEINPAVKVNRKAVSGFIPEKPLLNPVAAESSELARARAAASVADNIFELSKSAAVSSR